MEEPSRRGVDYIGVGVGALIINDKGEILLLLRNFQPEMGHWSIPGGAVEWFEPCCDAIRRECKEELGIDVQVVELLTVVDHIIREDRRHWVSLEYLVRIESGVASNLAEGESAELRWFPLDALPERLTQTTKEAVQAYLKRLGHAWRNNNATAPLQKGV